MIADDLRLRRWISRTLTAGLLLAVTVVAVGVLLGVVTGQGIGVDPASGGVLAEIRSGKPGSIVLIGLLLLALTPVAQLAAAALALGRAREFPYLGVALVVLGLLLGSLAVAAGLARLPGG